MDDITRWTVKRDKGQAGGQQGYKYHAYKVLISVFKLTLRMQTWVQILITACILRMVSSVLTLMNKENRPRKYKARLFDYGVPERSRFCKYRSSAVKIPTRKGQVLEKNLRPEPQEAEKNFWCELSCFSIQTLWILWQVLTLEVPADPSDREEWSCKP